MGYYRPKNAQPQRWDYSSKRLIIPERLSERLGSDRVRLHDVAGTLYWAHGNYGLGDLSRDYQDVQQLIRSVEDMLRRTTTKARIEYREWLEKERAAEAA
jgi:hypothetical protein